MVRAISALSASRHQLTEVRVVVPAPSPAISCSEKKRRREEEPVNLARGLSSSYDSRPAPTSLAVLLLGRWTGSFFFLASTTLVARSVDTWHLSVSAFGFSSYPPYPPRTWLAPWFSRESNRSQPHRKDRIFTGFRISCYGLRSHPGLASMLRIAPQHPLVVSSESYIGMASAHRSR